MRVRAMGAGLTRVSEQQKTPPKRGLELQGCTFLSFLLYL